MKRNADDQRLEITHAGQISKGGTGRLATWHLPGGPVGLLARCAATSNVEVGQTTYPVNRER